MFDIKRIQQNSQVCFPLNLPKLKHMCLIIQPLTPNPEPYFACQTTQERLEQRIIMLEETVQRLELENTTTVVS